MEKKFFQKPATYVGEVNINVTNLKNSLVFYRDFMGFKVLEETSERAVLTADGTKPILTLEQPKNVIPKERRTTGLYHFAILLPSRKDLGTFLKHLIQTKGHEIRLGASDHFVSEALYFDDPDGNGIEIACDRPSSEWNWNGDLVDMGTAQMDGEGVLGEAGDKWEGMPENTLMGHIHLHVAHLEETEKFYVDGLGFNIVTRYPGALFASTNGYHHHLGLNVWNGEGAKASSKNSVGLNWFSLIFPDSEKREKAVRKLDDMQVTVIKENDYYLVEDPSGNAIRLQLEE
ncbi:VOC family protein [Oceanobacillus sp. Castelsardo]|uniref:VOC family protein n=1 Tax=Oceanobacillus sp. Castelsardo TaxID=1851204 RepID=UPI00083980CC|nr:VOC family protein [Oceanobacillus sp. Castelsardo]